MSSCFQGLAHIAVYVRNREESIRFYVTALDFQVIYEGIRSKGLPSQMRYTLLRQKDCLVELLAQDSMEPERLAQMGIRGAVDHFGLVVPNLENALSRLAACSVLPEGPTCVGDDLFGGFKSAFVRGPSGERIELFEFTTGAYEKYYFPGGNAADGPSLREQICEAGRKMYAKGFGGSNDGNLSVRLDEQTLLITPAGVCKGFLRPEDLLVIDLDGRVISGQGKPSSETRMHLQVYRSRPDVRAICHAHPQKATAFAACRKLWEGIALPEIVFAVGRIALTEYATPTTEQVPQSIEKAILDADAILLANHGVLTTGPDIMAAYFRMEALEHAAGILFYAQLMGGAQLLSQSQLQELYEVKKKFYAG